MFVFFFSLKINTPHTHTHRDTQKTRRFAQNEMRKNKNKKKKKHTYPHGQHFLNLYQICGEFGYNATIKTAVNTNSKTTTTIKKATKPSSHFFKSFVNCVGARVVFVLILVVCAVFAKPETSGVHNIYPTTLACIDWRTKDKKEKQQYPSV